MDSEPQMNPRKIRLGLVIVTLMFLSSLALMATADGAVGKAVFFAIALVILLRAALFTRWLRQQRAAAAA